MPLQNSHLLNCYMSNQVIKEEAPELKEKLDIRKRKCTLSKEMQELMLRQLKDEMYNHNLYRSFANFFGVRGLSKLEEYYNLRAQEEMEHHFWILQYLNETDTEFIYPEIPAVKEKWENLEDPFDLTVDKEIYTTQCIHEMLDVAFETGDYFTWSFIMGHDPKKGRLNEEQREEESTSRTVRDIAYTPGSWLRKEQSILTFYNERS